MLPLLRYILDARGYKMRDVADGLATQLGVTFAFELGKNTQVGVKVNFYRQAYNKVVALEGLKVFKY